MINSQCNLRPAPKDVIFPQVTAEVGKQISNYSIKEFNGGHYPLPQTMLVVLVELIKLVATIVRSGCQRPSFDPVTLRHSFKFLLPSLLYAGELRCRPLKLISPSQ